MLKLSAAFAVMLWSATQFVFASDYTVTIKNVTGSVQDGKQLAGYTLYYQNGSGTCITDSSPTADADGSIAPGHSQAFGMTTRGSGLCRGAASSAQWYISIENNKGVAVNTGTLSIGGGKGKFPALQGLWNKNIQFGIRCSSITSCEFFHVKPPGNPPAKLPR